MLLVEVVRRAVCLPLALAGFSVINVDLDVLLPPPFSCQAVFITIEKKRRPSLEIAECSVVTVFIRCSARERRRMPIMQHIPCPTSSSSRLQTKRALIGVVGRKLESTASRVQRPPVKRQAANNPRPQAATKETPLLCYHGHTFSPIVSLALVVFCCKRFLGRHLHHRYYYPVHNAHSTGSPRTVLQNGKSNLEFCAVARAL